MLKNITMRKRAIFTEYSIEFTNYDGGGFSFDADENGNPVFANDCARLNYEYAMAHPDMFPVEFNKFTKRDREYIEDAHGTCQCGEEVTLTNVYHGACYCRNCGQWYNLFGQELIPPAYWED